MLESTLLEVAVHVHVHVPLFNLHRYFEIPCFIHATIFLYLHRPSSETRSEQPPQTSNTTFNHHGNATIQGTRGFNSRERGSIQKKKKRSRFSRCSWYLNRRSTFAYKTNINVKRFLLSPFFLLLLLCAFWSLDFDLTPSISSCRV